MSKKSTISNSKKEDNSERESLRSEIYILNERIKIQELEFNLVEDEDLIDALIYEQMALQSRFACLMKRARELKLEVSPFDRFVTETDGKL
ncbi:MAG: hypothetical protein FWG70_02930 [Oscillospiraceae bacterium]|nr:hypothetical protein [Oscillospiraceae bacterium]